jgi:tRNA threonylcarbamoyl adenosine modification protein (Sua5/YciO/YrdC/YwlC family)
LLKQGTPGAFTFILEATKEVPRRLSHPSRKTIGLRVPQHTVLRSLLEAHNQPILGTTLILPGDDAPLYEASEIEAALGKQLAAIVDAGPCPHMPTTVVDLTEMGNGGEAVLLRQGAADPAVLGL